MLEKAYEGLGNILLKGNSLIGIFVGIGAIVALWITFYTTKHPSASETQSAVKVVAVHKVHRETIQEKAHSIGTIESLAQTTFRARNAGIARLCIEEGKKVQKGTLLAIIHNPDQEKAYGVLKEAQNIAKGQLDRALKLLALNAMSKTMVEDKKLALLDAQKRTFDAQTTLEESHLRAPFDGVIGLFKVKEGSQVHQGDMIVQFYNPSTLIVRFDLPLVIAKQVQKNTNLWVNNTLYPLTYLQQMVDEETHMCPAYAYIDCPMCIIGSTTDVEVVLREHSEVLVVPFKAVFLKNGSPFVYVVRDKKATLTPVALGIRDQDRIEITAGLKEGDLVIPDGQLLLYDGLSIQLQEESFPKTDSKE